ncbi:MAG: exo-beta-N-acetylmuramidase NamZ domain-containing protein [Bacteroidota bacterium]
MIGITSCTFSQDVRNAKGEQLRVGADRVEKYLPLIRSKRVAVVANQTSRVSCNSLHLVDFLVKEQIDVRVVFAPEHGFRGDAGAGEKVVDGKDPSSGVKVVSLYGRKLKPASSDLADVDVILFDIQDVGARFYTYISTLQYVMESAAEEGIPVMVLDRPNPNGHIVDGPVLDTSLRTFVGMNPIPVLHGCTIGEYAKMLVGEHWLRTAKPCSLTVISVEGYSHDAPYELPIPPSPNLSTSNAIYLYPSLCLFEGTRVSVGRGTDFPFEVYGFPGFSGATFEFKPTSQPGKATHPPYEDTLCMGRDLRGYFKAERPVGLDLSFMIDAYRNYPDQEVFFIPFFESLCGDRSLKRRIKEGQSEEQIRKSWEKDLAVYRATRKKYLLYPDSRR